MKKMLFAVFALAIIASCNNEKTKEEKMSGEKKETAVSSPPDLPYKMLYTNWEMGDPKNLKMVLDMYKNWEDNKLDAVASNFGDSAIFEMAAGVRLMTTKQSLLDSLKSWRGQSDKLSSDIITGLSMHSPEKNEDWVLIWAMNHSTDKAGKVDSVFSNDNWQVKNGKLVYLSSLEQKPIKP